MTRLPAFLAGDDQLPPVALVTYASARGARAGIVLNGTLHDAASGLGDERYSTMRTVLADWHLLEGRVPGLDDAAVADATGLLPPVPDPSAIFCAGANYTDHMAEMAAVLGIPQEPDPHTIGVDPWHFLKAPGCLVGPGEPVSMPAHSAKVDWEAELVAVIGRPARDVAPSDALSHVAGYTIANDLSARDWISRDRVPGPSPFKYDWISNKCWDGACPLGPAIVPASAIRDPQDLAISLSVNGRVMQDSHTSRMIFTVAEQIAFLSTRLTLRPGDLILTGTPAGVGMAHGAFLGAGDRVAVSVEGLGTLVNTMRAAPARSELRP